MADEAYAQRSHEQLPENIDGHKILEHLDEGGMGKVYRAEHKFRTVIEDNTHKPMPVALKVAIEEQWQYRLGEEARWLSGLDHPHIVKIYDLALDHNPPYFVMEYLRNGSLQKRVSGERWTPKQCIDLLSPIADALDFVHKKGSIHNDIKPGNILFDDEWVPKLGDFGIASWSAIAPEITSGVPVDAKRMVAASDKTLQHSNSVDLVTYIYAAPERFGGEPPGDLRSRADIYSLAVVAYQLLAGSLPFDLEDNATDSQKQQFIERVRNDPPPEIKGLHKAFQGTLNKALDKQPSSRHNSAVEFIKKLKEADEIAQHGIKVTASLVAGLSFSSEDVLLRAEENFGNKAVEKSFQETQSRNAIGLGAWSAFSILLLLTWAYGLSDMAAKRPYLFRDNSLLLLQEGEWGLLGLSAVANPIYPLVLALLLLACLMCRLFAVSSKRTAYLVLWSDQKNKDSLRTRLRNDATTHRGLKPICEKLRINYRDLTANNYTGRAKQLVDQCESKRLLSRLDILASGNTESSGSCAASTSAVIERRLTRLVIGLTVICLLWISIAGLSPLFPDHWQSDLVFPVSLTAIGIVGLIVLSLVPRE